MKKLILAACAALLSLSAVATTLNPIQLLNPAGSTSGQAIVSTGATTAPAWTTVTPAAIGGLTAASNLSDVSNTVTALANLGGLSTAAAASTYLMQSNAASTYATITNLALKAPLASPTFTGTVTIPAGASITTPNIVGTVGIAAASGSVGQHQSFGNAINTVSLPSATATNCFSQSLTAGSYQLSGVIEISAGVGNTMSFPTGGLSTTSATLPAFGGFVQTGSTFGTASSIYMVLPTVYFDLTTTTTVYVVGSATNTGAGTCAGNITVLRIH